MKVLLLEDDPVLSEEISKFLKRKGISCDCVFNGRTFLNRMADRVYDILLLDINVPEINGLEVCRKVREKNPEVSIIMITAYGDIKDKSDAFKAGADDYLVKPFHLEELLLRMESVQRRRAPKNEEGAKIVIDDLVIQTDDSKVFRAGKEIALTPREYQLLITLAEAKGKTVSKKIISERIWEVHLESNMSTIEVYINFLRKKIDKDYSVKLIHTRPGYGYFMRPELKENEA
jgi:DNA-binding response OmpR family regulator